MRKGKLTFGDFAILAVVMLAVAFGSVYITLHR